MSNLAISYARFSSLPQGEGDSLRRQAENARRYAQENGLVLDEARSFRDLGVSAYDQSNIRKGALGLFLRAVEQGLVPPGTTLIVESFDRLSRAQPLDALGVFKDILDAGLNLVILTSPPKVFSRKSVADNVFQLFEALLDMYRAHGESLRKGELVGKAWAEKKRLAKAGTGTLLSRKAPHWIEVTLDPSKAKQAPDRRTATLIPDRAAVALRIIELAEADVGAHTIIKRLHAERVPAWSNSGRWQPSYVQKLLRNPALYGAIELDGEVIEGHYPLLIEKGRFLQLQKLRSDRATTTNRNRKGETITNLFSGLLRCGYCGATMTISGHKSITPYRDRKYVGCHGARIGATGCKMKSWYMDELEPTLLLWLTKVDFARIMGVTSQADQAREEQKLATLEADLARATTRVENTKLAIADGARSMVADLIRFEEAVDKLTREAVAQRAVVAASATRGAVGAGRMKGLILLFRALKTTTDPVALRQLREQVMAGVGSVVERIVLYPTGRSLSDDRSERYAVVTFRDGSVQQVDPEDCVAA